MYKSIQLAARALWVLVPMLLIRSCYEEVPIPGNQSEDGFRRILSFDQRDGMVDMDQQTILFSACSDTLDSFAPEVDFYGYQSLHFGDQLLVKGEVNELGTLVVNHSYPIVAKNKNQADTFSLIFTTLPMVHIMTSDNIPDEPKVLSRMYMQYPGLEDGLPAIHSFESYAGIEIRGVSSMRYNKKSYGLELWQNKSGMDYSASLLGMRYTEDWILDAMYIDPFRMRNKISFELWKKISQPPAEDQRDDLFPGIECRLVELFINNNYRGVYSLNEKLDPNLLRYTSDQYKVGGVLYKAIQWSDGATLFETYNSEPPNSFLWDGWEQIYPRDYIAWGALDELRKLIVEGEDELFKQRIGSLIDLDNAVNYYLFINLLKAYDNAGKNSFLGRYTDQSRMFLIPWDIDGSWGIWWDGSYSDSGGLIENQLFKRLKETNAGDFNGDLEDSWEQYRRTFFTLDSLLQPINQYYTSLSSSGAMDRENQRWEDISIDFQEEYAYISNWIEERLGFLDKEFED